jgi:hypothetical protein
MGWRMQVASLASWQSFFADGDESQAFAIAHVIRVSALGPRAMRAITSPIMMYFSV